MFTCTVCTATFACKDNMFVYVQSIHGVRKFECDVATRMNDLNLSNDVHADTFNRENNPTKHPKINGRRWSVIRYALRVSAVPAPSVPPVIMQPTVPAAPTDMWDDSMGEDVFRRVDLDFQNPGPSTSRPNENSKIAVGTNDFSLGLEKNLGFVEIGSSYIEVPPFIALKKAVINPQNTDKQCFKWTILAKHVAGDNKQRVGFNYTVHEDKYNFSGLSFPTQLDEIKMFEKNNLNVSVNVYGLQECFQPLQKYLAYEVNLLRVADEEKQNHFDLLLLHDSYRTHYTYINDFSRLVRSQVTSFKGKHFFCKRCFTCFNNIPKKTKLWGQAALDEHKLICGSYNPILQPAVMSEDVKPTSNTALTDLWGDTYMEDDEFLLEAMADYENQAGI